MKNYNEVAESVFRRSKEVIKQNNKRRRTLIAIGSAASCLLIAGVVGFGAWKNSLRSTDAVLSNGQFANDNVNHSSEDDTVSVTDHVNGIHEDIKASAGDGIVGIVPDPNIPPDYPTLAGENDYNGGNGNVNAIGTDSLGSADSGDIVDSSGVSDNDTSSPANDPGYATSFSEPASDTDIEESKMIWPVGGPDGGIIIEVPYWRGGYAYHEGVDIAAEAGTPIYAAADGVVIEADHDVSRGNYIVIQNDDGYQTHYYHAGELFARVDQRVAAGDIIAEVGATGMATAPFLHFEVRLDDTAVDPIELLPQHDRLMSWNQCDGVPLAE